MQKKFNALILLLGLMLLTACGTSAARLNNWGNDAYNEGSYEESLDYYREALQEDPDISEPYYNSGNAYQRQGNLDSAETRYKQANRTAEGELAQNSNYNLGNTYFQRQDWENAVEAYKQALRLNPADQDAKYNLELALKQLEQQQQQQQQQGGGGQQQQDPNQQGGGQGEQQQQPQGQDGDQQQGQGGGQPEQDEQGQSDQGQQEQQGSGGGRSLTPEEAEQLLDALGQDSQTLQERLQEGFFAPGRPPEQDW